MQLHLISLKRAKAIGLPMDDLITHEFPLEQINEAHQTNLAMKGLKDCDYQ